MYIILSRLQQFFYESRRNDNNNYTNNIIQNNQPKATYTIHIFLLTNAIFVVQFMSFFLSLDGGGGSGSGKGSFGYLQYFS